MRRGQAHHKTPVRPAGHKRKRARYSRACIKIDCRSAISYPFFFANSFMNWAIASHPAFGNAL